MAEFVGVRPELVLQCSNQTDPLTSTWTLFIDGSSNILGSGVGIILFFPQKQVIEKAVRLGFKASNNEAEYEALHAGLRLAIHIEAKDIMVYCDSLLVVNQFSGEYATRDERIALYLKLVKI